MKLIKLDIPTKEGGTVSFWLNPKQLVGITFARVPGEITGPGNLPLFVEKAALDLGVKMLVTDYSVEELLKILEAVEE